MSVNKVILVGNLGKDPEVRYLEGGVAVATFPMATSERYKDRNTGEQVSKTEWHNVVLWRGLAEVAEKFLKKGNQVYIEGKLRTRSWDDQSGNKRYTTEVIADNLTMLGSRQDSNAGSNVPPPSIDDEKENSTSKSQPSNTNSGEPTKESVSSQDDTEVDDLPF